MDDRLRTLVERRDYLTERIAAKVKVGWDSVYDVRERDALTWAVDQLSS